MRLLLSASTATTLAFHGIYALQQGPQRMRHNLPRHIVPTVTLSVEAVNSVDSSPVISMPTPFEDIPHSYDWPKSETIEAQHQYDPIYGASTCDQWGWCCDRAAYDSNQGALYTVLSSTCTKADGESYITAYCITTVGDGQNSDVSDEAAGNCFADRHDWSSLDAAPSVAADSEA